MSQTEFTTNIDCAKRLLFNYLNKNPIEETNFLIGDTIIVYEDSDNNKILMSVVGRKWSFYSGSPILLVELGLLKQYMSITDFEKYVMSFGFPRN